MTCLAPTHGEVAITCAKCGARQVFRGSKWEIAVAAEMWRKQHKRPGMRGERPARTIKSP